MKRQSSLLLWSYGPVVEHEGLLKTRGPVGTSQMHGGSKAIMGAALEKQMDWENRDINLGFR